RRGHLYLHERQHHRAGARSRCEPGHGRGTGMTLDTDVPAPVDAAPAEGGGEAPTGGWLDELTPRQIVAELDRYIIGEGEAKKAVAIALRNRWRRQRVPDDLRDEIVPNNLILIGPTGVGKTEIARRLARLA